MLMRRIVLCKGCLRGKNNFERGRGIGEKEKRKKEDGERKKSLVPDNRGSFKEGNLKNQKL